MSALTIIAISGLIQGGLLWGAIRLLDPANTSNKPSYAVLVGVGLALLGYAFGIFLIVPLLALGWILLRGYDLGIPRTVGVLVLLGAGNWAVGKLLGMLVASLGLRTVEIMLVAGAGLVIGRWLWKRRGNTRPASAELAPPKAVARTSPAASPAPPSPPPPSPSPVAAKPATGAIAQPTIEHRPGDEPKFLR